MTHSPSLCKMWKSLKGGGGWKLPVSCWHIHLTVCFSPPLLPQSTSGFELYLCFSPLATKALAMLAVTKLLKWIRKEEDRLFILNSLTYWDPIPDPRDGARLTPLDHWHCAGAAVRIWWTTQRRAAQETFQILQRFGMSFTEQSKASCMRLGSRSSNLSDHNTTKTGYCLHSTSKKKKPKKQHPSLKKSETKTLTWHSRDSVENLVLLNLT